MLLARFFLIGQSDGMMKLAITPWFFAAAVFASGQSASAWDLVTETDPMTDRQSVYIQQVADIGLTDRYGSETATVITVGCHRGTVSVNIAAGVVFDARGATGLRLDDDPVYWQEWHRSADWHAIVAPEPYTTIEALTARARLTVDAGQRTDAASNVAVFNISGLGEHLETLWAACPRPAVIK